MKNFAKICISLAILFFAPVPLSWAGDILAFDFNFGSDEIDVLEKRVAEENAMGKHTRLIVIPPTSKQDRALKKELATKWADLDKAAALCSKRKDKSKKTIAGCDTLDVRRTELDMRFKDLYARIRLDRSALMAFVEKVCSSPQKVDRLFMSGHDGTGDFYGDIANLSLEDMRTLSNKYPQCMKNNVKAAYFWGCYTGTSGKNRSLWPSIFPKAGFVAGYDDLSPASFRPGNLATLSGLLKSQDALMAASDRNKVKSLMKQINELHWHSSVYLRNCNYYYSRNEVASLDEIVKARCGKAQLEYPKQKAVFGCYWNAKKGCTDVPTDTGNSPLRTAYNFLQQNEECFYGDTSGPERPDTARTIRLIFYKNVLANIGRTYSKEISSLNSFFQKKGTPSNLKIPDFSLEMKSRQEMIEWAKNTRQFFSGMENGTDWKQAKQQFFSLEKKILHLECVPFGWVEPNAMIPPSC